MMEGGLISQPQFEELRDELLAEGPEEAAGTGIPERVGPYRVLGVLGEGGMGVVLRARHEREQVADRQGGDVAVKLMHPNFARRPELRKRFIAEGDGGVELSKHGHPGIARVHGVLTEGRLALVMDLVPGRSLWDVMEGGATPWDEARGIVEQVIDAVAFAHSHQVVHRDLKPDNIVVSPMGRAKIIDFGIALWGGATRHTQAGSVLGSLDYMAPEQALDTSKVDARADQYSLALMTWELLAGRLPWESGLNAVGILAKKKEGLPPLQTIDRAVPRHVSDAVARALSSEPDDRFASMQDFGRALGLKRARTVLIEPPKKHEPSPQRPWLVPLAAVGGAVLATVIVLAVVGRQPATQPPAEEVTPEPTATSVAVETPEPTVRVPEPTVRPEPPPPPLAKVDVEAFYGSRSVDAFATVYVFRAGANVERAVAMAQGPAGQPVEVDGGTYDVLVVYEEDPRGPDGQRRERLDDVELEAGDVFMKRVTFPDELMLPSSGDEDALAAIDGLERREAPPAPVLLPEEYAPEPTPAPAGPALAPGPVADAEAEAAAQRAADHYAANRQDEALREVDAALARAPTARYEALRARILSAQGEYAQALIQLNSAIQLDPLNAALYEQRAAVHTALGDSEEADWDLKAVEAINTNTVPSMPPE